MFIPPSTENWKKRNEIIRYCVNVVDQSIDAKRKAIGSDGVTPEEERKLRATSYAQEVTVSAPVRWSSG